MTLRLASAATALLAALTAAAQVVPRAPVRSFQLPLFGPDGRKKWELRAASGSLVDGGRVHLTDLRLEIFAPPPADPGTPDLRLSSQDALVDPVARTASGPGAFTLDSAAYRFEGSAWTWDGRRQRLHVTGGVTTVFREELEDILK